MTDRYWYFDGECFYRTARREDAVAACEEAIANWLDPWGDGWAEEVAEVCWGTVAEVATETDREDHEPGCTRTDEYGDDCHCNVPADQDYTCNYSLMPPSQPGAPNG